MADDRTRQRLRATLAKLEAGDGRLPVAELVDLVDAADVDLEIDRRGDPTVVYAAPRRSVRFDRLSKRELEVAELTASGLSNREIANRLFVSVATAKDHVHAVLRKCGFESRAEVAAAWHGTKRR